jgi:hypothetical protein
MLRRWTGLARLAAATTLLALSGLAVGAMPATAEQTGHPTITVNPIPRTATVGTVLKAQATLSNAVNPNYIMGFELYDPAGVMFFNQKVTVTGNGTYASEAWGPAQKAGTWTWKVQYSDANNFLAIGTATVVVGPVAPPPSRPPATDPRAWVWPLLHQGAAAVRKVFSGLK